MHVFQLIIYKIYNCFFSFFKFLNMQDHSPLTCSSWEIFKSVSLATRSTFAIFKIRSILFGTNNTARGGLFAAAVFTLCRHNVCACLCMCVLPWGQTILLEYKKCEKFSAIIAVVVFVVGFVFILLLLVVVVAVLVRVINVENMLQAYLFYSSSLAATHHPHTTDITLQSISKVRN